MEVKDFTKLFCDLISFGSQIDKHNTSIEQIMSCLAGIVLREDLAHIGTLDYDELRDHILRLQSCLKGSDFDIDVRPRPTQVRITDIVEFHGKHTVKFSDGSSLSFYGGVTHY